MKNSKNFLINLGLIITIVILCWIEVGVYSKVSAVGPKFFVTGNTILNISPDIQIMVDGSFLARSIQHGKFFFEKTKKYRIIAFGDSVTVGGGLAANQTYVYKLEQMLNTNYNNTVEVLNFGIGDTSTYQHLEILERFVLPNNPDLIILQMNENDYSIKKDMTNISPNIEKIRRQLKKIPQSEIPKWLGYRLQLYEELSYHESMNNSMLAENVRKPLSLMLDLIRQSNIPFIIFVVPCPDDSVDYHYFQLVEQYIKDNKVPYFSLRNTSFAYLPLEEVYMVVRGNTVLDSHPKEIGHQIIAEHLYSIIVKNRYLGDR